MYKEPSEMNELRERLEKQLFTERQNLEAVSQNLGIIRGRIETITKTLTTVKEIIDQHESVYVPERPDALAGSPNGADAMKHMIDALKDVKPYTDAAGEIMPRKKSQLPQAIESEEVLKPGYLYVDGGEVCMWNGEELIPVDDRPESVGNFLYDSENDIYVRAANECKDGDIVENDDKSYSVCINGGMIGVDGSFRDIVIGNSVWCYRPDTNSYEQKEAA